MNMILIIEVTTEFRTCCKWQIINYEMINYDLNE